MKKLVTLFMAFILLGTLCITFVSAASVNSAEQAILDKLSTKETVNGREYGIPANYIQMAENFFLSYEVTDEQKDEILPMLDKAIELTLSQKDKFSPNQALFVNFETNVKKQLLDIAVQIGNIVGLKVSYDGTNLNCVDENGYVWFSNAPVIKVTGGESSNTGVWAIVLSVVAVAAVAGASLLIVKQKKASATN